ncbi:MAG: cbb3-type cytochrome oxidase assembly protein CcoS [Flavobacteriales bacterium]|jgi:cbb3-type cytochrome oxidase maturation protein
MNVIFLLITASTVVALLFLAAFTWAVRSGQFDDDRSPAVRILGDALPVKPIEKTSNTSTNPNA